jgi:LPS export ABC transporter protein LptC
LSAGCGRNKETLPATADTIAVPYQELGGSTLYFYDGPRKEWKLESRYMRKNLDRDGKLNVFPVTLTLYDSSGETGTRVLADSGLTDRAMESFLVWGNVLVRTEDSLVIRAERLLWHKNTHKVTSDSFVQIETPEGDVLRGKGLDAWENFSRWSLKQSVTGSFPDFRNRMGQEGAGF